MFHSLSSGEKERKRKEKKMLKLGLHNTELNFKLKTSNFADISTVLGERKIAATYSLASLD
jgi:hypothetical protein